MKPGTKPKPSHLKLIEGNPGKRRIVSNSLPKGEIPNAPDHLDEEALAEWVRIAPGLHALQLLRETYRGPLAWSRWVKAERSLAKMGAADKLTGGLMIKTTGSNAIQNPLVGTANKAMADMVKYAAEFAMTPCAQARLSLDSASPVASKWAGLVGGIKS